MRQVLDQDTGNLFTFYPTPEFQHDLVELNKKFDCEHPQTEIRRILAANGARHFRRQCLRCGQRIGQAIPKIDVSANAVSEDIELPKAFLAEKEIQLSAIYQKHIRLQKSYKSSFWEIYKAHLNSEEWSRLRNKVTERAQNHCEGCGDREATQVHHTTYRNLGREFLFELIALCAVCHERLHRQEVEDGLWDTSTQDGGLRRAGIRITGCHRSFHLTYTHRHVPTHSLQLSYWYRFILNLQVAIFMGCGGLSRVKSVKATSRICAGDGDGPQWYIGVSGDPPQPLFFVDYPEKHYACEGHGHALGQVSDFRAEVSARRPPLDGWAGIRLHPERRRRAARAGPKAG
jgi:hypothetical protein